MIRPVHGTTYVICADAHLGDASSPSAEAFLAFLERVPTLGDACLLVGDIFDFWFSYRHAIPRHGFHVAAALAALARRVPVGLVGGNHDRWDAGFWRDDLGIAFSPSELPFRLGDRRGLAVHGDGLTETRAGARLLHRVLMSPVTRAAFGLLPPDPAFRLVQSLAPHLGDHPLPADHVLREATARQQRWAADRFAREPGLGLIVMGHTHRAAAADVAPGQTCLNPGAWFDGHRYAIATAAGTELRHFRP